MIKIEKIGAQDRGDILQVIESMNIGKGDEYPFPVICKVSGNVVLLGRAEAMFQAAALAQAHQIEFATLTYSIIGGSEIIFISLQP